MSEYGGQIRGERSAYERYLAGMDASMRQKVALTAALLLCRGRVADMGMGSGTGSHALASLYPELSVVGVDVSPTMVELARERYHLDNLRFEVGDIATEVFPPLSLSGIFDSSVLHHVTSFSGYDYEAAARALAVQATMLEEHGVLIVRDFVDPTTEGSPPQDLLMDLPDTDGDESSDPRSCHTAALFERFSREFRSLSKAPGFPLVRVTEGAGAGFRRYRVPPKIAAEFLLRKDYRADWESEVKEEYTYFSQASFENLFANLGLRMLASAPIVNPWIVRERYRDKVLLWDAEGRPLPFPPTNYLIAGERVPAGEGVRFRCGEEAPLLGYLERSCWRDLATGKRFDLVRRPRVRIDVIPYFVQGTETFVLCRMGYPRPILSCAPGGPTAVDGARLSPYVTEPLSIEQVDKPIAQTVEEVLSEVAGLEADELVAFHDGHTHYPSAGGIQEEVRSLFVEVLPTYVEDRIANFSGFSTSGRVRAIEAEQLLRAAAVGGLPDARLEVATHALLGRLQKEPGPWIGEEVILREAALPPSPRTSLSECLETQPKRRRFRRDDTANSPGFLGLHCNSFDEQDQSGRVVASRKLEYVVPRTLSLTTVAVAPLCRHGGEVWLGVDDDDLPAAQCFRGNSELIVAPAWRLPRDITHVETAKAWAERRLADEYGVTTGAVFRLGGTYLPSPSITPEVVIPLAIEVIGLEGPRTRCLHWIPLRSVRTCMAELPDGHLRVVALRAAHATGALAHAGRV